jgi:hypothetical protein
MNKYLLGIMAFLALWFVCSVIEFLVVWKKNRRK